jgi:hypothetical protein
MRAVLIALLLCSALPAAAAASDQAPSPDPLDGMTILRSPTPPTDTLIKMRTAKPAGQAPYLDPCQCVRGTIIRGSAPKPADALIQNRAPANIYDPATTIIGEKPKPKGEGAEDPYGAGRPLPPSTQGQQPQAPEKPDRPIGMG